MAFAYGSAKTYFFNNLRTAKYFLKHAGLPKRVWQGHNTSVGREDLLVYIISCVCVCVCEFAFTVLFLFNKNIIYL